MTEDSSDGGAFARAYDEWRDSPPDHRDPALTDKLRTTFREAWRNGDEDDRHSVLTFLLLNKEQSGADILVEALGSEDPQLATSAAANACCFDGWGFDMGPAFRPSFRAAARRLPEVDGFPPLSLYGHHEGDLDDRAERPFLNLYEDLRGTEGDGKAWDEGLSQRALDTYRTAWASGDPIEQAFVLHFLFDYWLRMGKPRVAEGADLVVEGLQTTDARLAPVASFTAWGMLEGGVDFGPSIRAVLRAHRDRFPEWRGSVWSALRALGEPDDTPPYPPWSDRGDAD